MEKFCSNCGKELKENADFCLNCGVAVNRNYKIKKYKIPGRGMSIASMVLGLCGIFINLTELTEVISIYFKMISFYDYYESFADALFGIFLFLGLSITGLVLSFVSRSKIKNGFNLSGIILNIVSIILTVIIFILIITSKAF